MTDKIKANPSMGFWRTWGLIVGGMVGSGIFMMPALLAPFGGLGLVSILLTAGGTFLLALMFGRLAGAIPKIGGPYAYAREGLGDFPAFLTVWGYSISVWTAIPAVTLACVGYLAVFFPSLAENKILAFTLEMIIIWSIILLNVKGVREASIFQLATSILKIIPLILIAIIGIIYFSPEAMPTFNPTSDSPLTALSAASALTMWAFVGIETATIPAEDVIEPEKTLPRALFWSIISVALIYFLATFGVMALVPTDVLITSTSPFADAAVGIMGPVGEKVLAIVAVIAMISTINAMVLSGAQTPLAAARDKLFPLYFKKMSKRATPAFSLYFAGVLSTIFLVMNMQSGLRSAFEFLLVLSTLSVVIPYAFSSVAEMVLIKKVGGKRQNSTMVLALGAFIYTTWVIIGTGAETVMWGFVLLLAGMPIYAWLHVHNEEVGECDE